MFVLLGLGLTASWTRVKLDTVCFSSCDTNTGAMEPILALITPNVESTKTNNSEELLFEWMRGEKGVISLAQTALANNPIKGNLSIYI